MAVVERSDPSRIRAQTWKYLWRRTMQEFVRDQTVDAAAGLTFFAVLSVFPAGLAIVALVGIIADRRTGLERMLSLLDQVAPAAVAETLRVPLVEVAGAPAGGATLIVAVVTAIWSASLYVGAFGRAMNRIHDVAEGRPYWKRKPQQLAVTVGLILLATVVVGVLILSGPAARAVGDLLGIGDTALAAWDVVKWPVLAVAVIAMTTVLYKATSNVHQPPLRRLSLGAALAIGTLGLASAGLAFYVSHVASYDRTFGTFAGIVVFLLWLFAVNLALLFGAEFNAELERGRQLQAGQESEVHADLALRDTTVSARARHSAEITERRGALLRQGETLPPREDTFVRRGVRRIRALWRRLTGDD